MSATSLRKVPTLHFPFALCLAPLSDYKLQVIRTLTLDEAGGDVTEEMRVLPETLLALEDFYRRSNEEVRKLIGDDNFHEW